MSDKATLRRLLTEMNRATRTEQAIIAEEAILKLFDAVRDELHTANERLDGRLAEALSELATSREQLAEANAEIARLKEEIAAYVQGNPVLGIG
jgi:chromosome segregation ATPase